MLISSRLREVRLRVPENQAQFADGVLRRETEAIRKKGALPRRFFGKQERKKANKLLDASQAATTGFRDVLEVVGQQRPESQSPRR